MMFKITDLIETGIKDGKDPKKLLSIIGESIDDGDSSIESFEKLYHEIYDHHLCDKYCKMMVEYMGRKWNVEDTSDVARKIGITFSSTIDDYTQYEFYAAMHIVWHMYNEIFMESGMEMDASLVAKMADAYLDDKFSPHGKLVNYFFFIEKNK